jgi:hypothetical protein
MGAIQPKVHQHEIPIFDREIERMLQWRDYAEIGNFDDDASSRETVKNSLSRSVIPC